MIARKEGDSYHYGYGNGVWFNSGSGFAEWSPACPYAVESEFQLTVVGRVLDATPESRGRWTVHVHPTDPNRRGFQIAIERNGVFVSRSQLLGQDTHSPAIPASAPSSSAASGQEPSSTRSCSRSRSARSRSFATGSKSVLRSPTTGTSLLRRSNSALTATRGAIAPSSIGSRSRNLSRSSAAERPPIRSARFRHRPTSPSNRRGPQPLVRR